MEIAINYGDKLVSSCHSLSGKMLAFSPENHRKAVFASCHLVHYRFSLALIYSMCIQCPLRVSTPVIGKRKRILKAWEFHITSEWSLFYRQFDSIHCYIYLKLIAKLILTDSEMAIIHWIFQNTKCFRSSKRSIWKSHHSISYQKPFPSVITISKHISRLTFLINIWRVSCWYGQQPLILKAAT